ncbi:MAG: hypothetical protein WD381_01370 [Balneolaceae bacterium]
MLITGYSPRKDAFVDLLKDVCDDSSSIKTISDATQIEKNRITEPDLCLLDLANIKTPSLEVIKKVKNHFTGSKIVAVHIYSSSLLVDPLFQAGINGYLTYEPTRSSIKKALDCVLSNETYIPEEILLP